MTYWEKKGKFSTIKGLVREKALKLPFLSRRDLSVALLDSSALSSLPRTTPTSDMALEQHLG